MNSINNQVSFMGKPPKPLMRIRNIRSKKDLIDKVENQYIQRYVKDTCEVLSSTGTFVATSNIVPTPKGEYGAKALYKYVGLRMAKFIKGVIDNGPIPNYVDKKLTVFASELYGKKMICINTSVTDKCCHNMGRGVDGDDYTVPKLAGAIQSLARDVDRIRRGI